MSVSYLSAVGIDLGTTYSSIGRLGPRGNVFLFNDKVTHQSAIPSVVSYANRTPRVGADGSINKKIKRIQFMRLVDGSVSFY